MVDAGRKLFHPVSHHQESIVGILAILFYYAPDHPDIPVVKSVEGLVQDQQVRILHEGSGNQDDSQFSAGHV